MKTRFLFSSPEGDLPAGDTTLARPFLINPSETHPFMSLTDYFGGIETFILCRDGGPLTRVLERAWKRAVALEEIDEIRIRSEKHGALYHLASVGVTAAGSGAKFAVSTALQKKSKEALSREVHTLRYLDETYGLPYLPKVHLLEEVVCHCDNGTETLRMALAEWFKGFHEWHLSRDKDNRLFIVIWDLEKGYRKASEKEAFAIYREASRILTLYYNPETFAQIYPWHHGAGDFVVRTSGEVIDVRMTTARGYGPWMIFHEEEKLNPLVAVIYFFLNLSVKMRLDKLDGIGDIAWADAFVLEAAIEGFFQALRTMATEARYPLGEVGDSLSLLKGFSAEELRGLFNPLLPYYGEGDPGDFSVIGTNLETHSEELYGVIQRFRG